MNILLLLLILWIPTVMGQSKIITEKVGIGLPILAIKLTKEQRNATLDKKLREEDLLRLLKADNDYDLEGVLLSLQFTNENVNKDLLQNIKTNTERRRRRRRYNQNDIFYKANIQK